MMLRHVGPTSIRKWKCTTPICIKIKLQRVVIRVVSTLLQPYYNPNRVVSINNKRKMDRSSLGGNPGCNWKMYLFIEGSKHVMEHTNDLLFRPFVQKNQIMKTWAIKKFNRWGRCNIRSMDLGCARIWFVNYLKTF